MKSRATAAENVYVWAGGDGAELAYVEEPG